MFAVKSALAVRLFASVLLFVICFWHILRLSMVHPLFSLYRSTNLRISLHDMKLQNIQFKQSVYCLLFELNLNYLNNEI